MWLSAVREECSPANTHLHPPIDRGGSGGLIELSAFSSDVWAPIRGAPRLALVASGFPLAEGSIELESNESLSAIGMSSFPVSLTVDKDGEVMFYRVSCI